MALKPRNLDWLNFTDGLLPFFKWTNGDKVLSFCNFSILIGLAGFGAQILFGISTLTGKSDQSAPLSHYDVTLLLLAVFSIAALISVRFRFAIGASGLLLGCGLFVLDTFLDMILGQENIQFETFIDLVLAPVTGVLGLLISATYIWCGLVIWKARDEIRQA